MAPTDDPGEVPSSVRSVVGRYHRVERVVGWALAALAAIVALGALGMLSLGRGILVAAGILAALRIPVVHRRVTARLASDTDPATVAAMFAGATPPMLAFQWGLADEINSTDEGASYEFSYLFGLRSASMTTEVRSRDPDGNVGYRLEVDVAVNGEPWARYTVSVRDRGEGSVVDLEGVSRRRFDLRRLPQGLVAGYYYADALAAQGYTVEDRTASLSIRDVGSGKSDRVPWGMADWMRPTPMDRHPLRRRIPDRRPRGRSRTPFGGRCRRRP